MKNNTTREDAFNNSHLLIRKKSSELFTKLEMSMPYLVLYEVASVTDNKSIYFEFSENDRFKNHTTYENYSTNIGELNLHSHDFYELTYVLSGELKMQIEDETIFYKAGDCCLCNKNIHHKEVMDRDTEIVLFLMKEEYVRNLIDNNYSYDSHGIAHPIDTFFYKLFSENTKNPFFDAKVYIDFRSKTGDIDSYLEVINKIIAEITGVRSGKSHMIKALMCQLIELLEDKDRMISQINEATLSNEEQIILQIALAYKDKNGIFTREEIADITGYNSDYIERILKRNTGLTLSAYGRNFLLKKATMMLTGTNMGIGEICTSLGYANRNYFNHLFLEKFGMLPSEYRKVARNQN